MPRTGARLDMKQTNMTSVTMMAAGKSIALLRLLPLAALLLLSLLLGRLSRP